MSGAALVLSVVDSRTDESHLVEQDTAALHRRFGKYPALCRHEVLAASLPAEPTRHCRRCAVRAQQGAWG